MARNPFTLPHGELPGSIPVFPLPGAVVMPGTELPLNIFEPRYLNMVLDVLGSQRMVGMVQPDPARPPLAQGPALYGTGCAGRITSFAETDDGRIMLVLSGVCRFDLVGDNLTARGYRQAEVDWRRFAVDYEEGPQDPEDRPGLLHLLQLYCNARRIEVSWDEMRALPAIQLANLLITRLPFDAGDKQALIEAVSLGERLRVLRGLLEMSVSSGESVSERRH